jgi:S-formylglutathione hydrolase FrmB
MASGAQVASAPAMRSWYQWSRPSVIDTSCPVRRTTTTCSIVGVSASATSAFGFNAAGAPRRYP